MMIQTLENPYPLFGWLLCAGVVLWAGLVGLRAARRRRVLVGQFQGEQELLRAELELVRGRRERETRQAPGWEGFANFVVERKVEHGASGICSFYLKPKDPRLKLPSFEPGQHLVIQLPVPGADQPLRRRYSLSDRPEVGHYRISVKQATAPSDVPGAPNGIGSTFLHRKVLESADSEFQSLLQVSAPAGSFSLDPLATKPVVLIGAGVGLTPMLSMFNSILESHPTRETWLLYGIRSSDEEILFEEGMLHPDFSDLHGKHHNLHVHLFYSRNAPPTGKERSPEGVKIHAGRIGMEALRTLLPSSNYEFYLCGPDAFMNQLEEDLLVWGVLEEEVFSERFGPPAKKAANSNFVPTTVRFAKSGKEIKTREEDVSLLEIAERAGVPISFDCRAGSCGQCQVPIAEGQVAKQSRTNYTCSPGSCLACSCLPKGDLVIDC